MRGFSFLNITGRGVGTVNEPAIRTEEHTNYHLSSILTDNGYGLEKCGVVGECSLTGDAGKLCMKEKV